MYAKNRITTFLSWCSFPLLYSLSSFLGPFFMPSPTHTMISPRCRWSIFGWYSGECSKKQDVTLEWFQIKIHSHCGQLPLSNSSYFNWILYSFCYIVMCRDFLSPSSQWTVTAHMKHVNVRKWCLYFFVQIVLNDLQARAESHSSPVIRKPDQNLSVHYLWQETEVYEGLMHPDTYAVPFFLCLFQWLYGKQTTINMELHTNVFVYWSLLL